MEPSVPFALLGSTQLLAVAAWVAFGGTALALSRGARGPAVLAALGALVLAAADVATGVQLGTASSDALALARCAGALLVGAGLYAGALRPTATPEQPGQPDPPDGAGASWVHGPGARLADRASGGRLVEGAAPAVVVPLAGVVVPLASAPAPAALAAAATVAAALAAWRGPGGRVGRLLGLGLLLTAVAVAVGPIADDGRAQALTATSARGLGAVVVLAALVVVARTSLLSKVVAAIVAGVLVMAAAAVGVVGTVVTSSFDDQAASLVEQAAQGRLQALSTSGEVATGLATILQAAYEQRKSPAEIDAALQDSRLGGRSQSFAAVVAADGAVRSLGGRAALTSAEALALGQAGPVRFAFEGSGADALRDAQPFLVRLVGESPSVALAVVAPAARATPDSAPASVFVYGQRLGDAYAADDFDAGGYGLSVLVGDRVVASNRSDSDQRRLERIARDQGVAGGLARDGETVRAEGDSPTVRFVPLTGFDAEPVGVLALSRGADESLAAQRDALQALLLTAILTTIVIGAVAVVLGRRTVDPVRRLTVAAERIGAGDLSVRTGLSTADEVGTLSRSFDAMTGNLSRLTDDLRGSAARLSTVLASMSDGLVATDSSGRVTSVNRAAVTMAGLPDERSALGRTLGEVLDLVGPDGEVLADPSLRLRDAPGELRPVDGGAEVPVRVAIAPLESGDGVVLVLRDTTREREVERMKTEFLSNVSHELRTPLTPIRGYADILVSRAETLRPDQVARFSETILAESIKMNRVVDLLVDVAAIEAGRVQASPRAVSVRTLLDERLAAWQSREPSRAGDLKRRVASGLPAVHVDPSWLAKALDELVDNALKYSVAGTPVTLLAEAAPDGSRVRLAVRDRGPGIAAADQRLLFTSFEQVDGSATRRVGGLGLGLSFVRRLADDAGYGLDVESAVGSGSQFSLDVPASESSAPRPTASRAPAKPSPAKPPAPAPAAKRSSAKPPAPAPAKPAAKRSSAKPTPAKRSPAKPSPAKPTAAKPAPAKPTAAKPAAKRASAKPTEPKPSAKRSPVKPPAAKPAAKRASAKPTAAKRSPAKPTAAKPPAKRAPAKPTAAKPAPAKRLPVKPTAAKRSPAR